MRSHSRKRCISSNCRLPELDQKFHLKAKGEEMIAGRKACVIQADRSARKIKQTPQSLADYDTVDTNYKKFRVEHRILPIGSVP